MDNNNDGSRPIFNVNSYGQQGGITAGQVNIGKPQRILDATDRAFLKGELKKFVKDKSKEIQVNAVMGDVEAINLKEEMVAFLRSEGYNAMGGQSMFTNNPKGLGFEINPTTSELEKIIIGVHHDY